MKFICQGTNFAQAVQIVGRAVSSKSDLAILECIKIEAFDNCVKLSGTDSYLSIQKTIPADVLEDGECVVSSKIFCEVVQKFPSVEIELSLEGSVLYARYSGNVCNFGCKKVEDFPEIEIVKKEKELEISVGELKKLISKTIFAVANEDGRPMLKGCCLHTRGDELVAVALDGHRMSVVKTNSFKTDSEFKIIIPTRSLNEFIKLLEKDEEKVTLIISESKVMINFAGCTIISQLIKGDFVVYDNIIPKEFNNEIKIHKNAFKEALGRILLISKADKNNIVKFNIGKEIMSLTAKGENVSEIDEKIVVVNSGNDIEIAFNAKFIMDIINVTDEDYINLYIKNINSACVVRPVGNDNMLNLILPLKIK